MWDLDTGQKGDRPRRRFVAIATASDTRVIPFDNSIEPFWVHPVNSNGTGFV
ncbi:MULTISPECIES: hypothetical protein [unclassified Leptolyngbya]|uniref:hypothetical protein n=1 Tax=unclassified Leptolyngbya TaxID=2650499 RepID=UPI0016827DAD|nr:MULTISPECIES: hypothetical protein [unclassified Leptolyngbya]MBD1912002.1 hypothetical protein [Leptolyngbya sp. FACHB-8]MBD2155372.1 hypothetical protein [Leptolyngbya sp. FACHB-16]